MPVSITADRIRQRRKELGMSADSLAEKIGVSRATMFRYENGDIEKVPVALIPLLAISLHTTPSYLMGWNDEAPNGSQAQSAVAASDEAHLLQLYRELNDEGQEKLIDYADDLVTSGKYIKNNPSDLGQEA